MADFRPSSRASEDVRPRRSHRKDDDGPRASHRPGDGVIPFGRKGSGVAGRLRRYLSCLRPVDILVLQGSPLVGAAFAFHGPALLQNIGALAILTLGNVLLMAHVFVLNDWAGLTGDLSDPNKNAKVFTVKGAVPREIGILAVALLSASLLLFSRLGITTLVLAIIIAGLSALYSLPLFNWKGRPLLNSIVHLAGGVIHFLLGYSLGGVLEGHSFAIACFFAITFAAGHLTQEVRDHTGDSNSEIRTNAVTFGSLRTFVMSLILFTFSYVLLVLLALEGVIPRSLAGLGLLYPIQLYWSIQTMRRGLDYRSVSRLQTRYRVLFAVIGVAMLAAAWMG